MFLRARTNMLGSMAVRLGFDQEGQGSPRRCVAGRPSPAVGSGAHKVGTIAALSFTV